MISFLRGTILNKSVNYIILDVNGVGYQVFIGASLRDELKMGQNVEFYIHQHIREDASDLYGFKNMAELEMFELLLSISGIGPKSALGVLSIASIEDIKESISRGDPDLLTKVSGIGKKTAERVVLELREKINKIANGEIGSGDANCSAGGDEIDALMSLGYSLQQSRDALRQVGVNIKDSGERIREALKLM